jgi:hypothetical protein
MRLALIAFFIFCSMYILSDISKSLKKITVDLEIIAKTLSK